MFYEKDERNDKSLAEIISSNFNDFNFGGTCLSLEEFDEMHGVYFEKQPQNFTLDYLVSFCKYIYNFLFCLNDEF